MARNGSGIYTLPAGNPVVAGTPITSLWANTTLSDLGSETTNSIDKGGRTVWTANLPAGGFVLTGLGAGAAAGQSVRWEQVDLVGSGTIASAATCSIFGAAEQCQSITGTTTITSFGANTAGQLRRCRVASALQLTYNATSLIIPGAANLALLAGDWFEVKGAGGSNAEVVQVTRAAALTTRLSDLGAAAAANTIGNTNYAQTWNWTTLGSGQVGLTLTGTSASNLGTVLEVVGAGAGSGNPAAILKIRGESTDPILNILPAAFTLRPPIRTVNANGVDCTVGAGSADPATNNVNGGSLSVLAGDGGLSASTGGSIFVKPGAGPTPGVIALRDAGALTNLLINSSAISILGSTKLVLDQKHVYVDNSNGTPTISSGGGTGATIAGSDVAFEVTIGTGSPTSVVVNFANAWTTAPAILIPTCSQVGATIYATAVSTTQVTLDSNGVALSSGVKVRCVCMALQ